MAPELAEALRGLCRRHGWTYAVLWGSDPRDPRVLVMKDSCYLEEQMRNMIDGMRNQAYIVGQGSIGVAALSGRHQWIYSDVCPAELNSQGPNDKLEVLQGNSEWQHQFSAGVGTIVIISLPSFGALECGSDKKITVSMEFVDQVAHLFQQLESMRGLQHADIPQSINVYNKSSTAMSANSSDVSCSYYNATNSFNDESCEELMATALLSKTSFHSSSVLSQRFDHSCQSREIIGEMNPQVLGMPIISHSTCVAKDVNNPIQGTTPFFRNSSNCITKPVQGAATDYAEPQVFFSPNSLLTPTSSVPDNSEVICSRTDNWPKTLATSQRQLPAIGIQAFPNTLLDMTHSSSSFIPMAIADVSSDKSSSVRSFAPELPNSFVSQVLTSDHTTLSDSKENETLTRNNLGNQPPEKVTTSLSLLPKDNQLQVTCSSSSLVGIDPLPSGPVENSDTGALNSLDTGSDRKRNSSDASPQMLHDTELFDVMDLDLSPGTLDLEQWETIIPSSCTNLSKSVSELEKGSFPEFGEPQLLDVDVGNINVAPGHFSVSSNFYAAPNPHPEYQTYREHVPLVGLPCVDFSVPECNLEKIMHGSPKEATSMSHSNLWIDESCSVNAESAVTNHPKKSEEATKVAKRRARPGESTRPRPKDRQLIQDRVKELREIVPNGAKCSIDALLDRTIKYMLFMQSVMKYAGKLKQVDEPKMIGDESGVILKDNSGGGGSGATWAFEVAGQTMVCPIIVEDLNPPGQMVIEMLCEERGLFLEIADIIRGFGLTILKGVMETRDHKIWARFLVEANKDLTRMDIFLSLVQLLQQTNTVRSSDQLSKGIDKATPEFATSQQTSMPIPVSLADRLQ
ncbi:Transcription factor MYC/MYB N-terminal protein [Dioscorea alata]|uniref:Transcription factor MYC/MYB N-terminal protein n=1 Tax=Dioscorea alata TaxID=55571 RepID=A0ACB7WFI1_DIOAL|nr:Transcription factor MYC/MYB N-terminal protein [Dioscorea alata]